MRFNKYILFFYFLFSLILVGYVIGFKNLIPSEIDWIFTKTDLISYYLPWYFYASDDWSFNIFKNYNYGLEISEGLLFADSVQILNPILKLLKNIFNFTFQYLSFWQILCITLQGFFSYKIIYYKTNCVKYSFLSSLFFILLPFFLDRLFIHISLAAHWLILWCIYLSIKYNINKSILKWSLLIFLSIFININIALIIILYLYLYLTFLIIFQKNSDLKKILLLYLYFTFLILVFLTLAGFFSISFSNMPEFGFGYYKSNILTFFDSEGGILILDWSILFKNIYNFRGEEEGFAYLGLSIYVIFIYLLFHLNYNELFNKQKIFYLTTIIIFLSLSLTNKISVGSFKFIEIPLNIYLYGILSVVRATGRYIWIPAYLVIIFLFIQVYRTTINKKYLSYILIILICFQILDQSKAILELKKSFTIREKLNSKDLIFWKKISKNYPYFRTSLVVADPEGLRINGKIIAKNNFKGTDVVYLSRTDRSKLTKARYDTFTDIYNKSLDHDSVYWIHPDHLSDFIYIYGMDNNFSIFEFKSQNYIIKNKTSLNLSINKKISFNNLNLPDIKFNSKLNPHANKSFFGLGWFTKGPFWSDGMQSSIFFKYIPNIKKIIFEVEIFNYNQNTINNYEFYLNENLIKNFKVTNKHNYYLIEVPINHDNQKQVNNLIFRNKNKITKADISIYPDPRLLGFKIKKFYIE